MKHKTFLAFSIAISALVSATDSAAEIYKWVDENGNVVFSERKPPGGNVKAEKVTPKPAYRRSVGDGELADEENQPELSDEAKLKAQEEKRKAEEKAEQEADIAEKNCNSARDRLVSLQRPRINRVAEDGSRTVIGEEERLAGIEEAEKAVSDWCK